MLIYSVKNQIISCWSHSVFFLRRNVNTNLSINQSLFCTDNKITPSGLKKTPSRVSFSSDVSIYTNGRNGSLIARNSSTAPLYTPKELLKQSLIEKYTSCRWLVTFTCFITVTCSIMLRQCISMVVVCMESNYEAGQYDVMTNHSNTTRNDTQSNTGVNILCSFPYIMFDFILIQHIKQNTKNKNKNKTKQNTKNPNKQTNKHFISNLIINGSFKMSSHHWLPNIYLTPHLILRLLTLNL